MTIKVFFKEKQKGFWGNVEMILYITIIVASTFIVALFNSLFGGYPFSAWQVILWVVISVILSIALDGLIAFIHRLIPYKYYKENNAYFREKKGERKFYEKLKIRVWKDKIPELGGKLKYFDKSKIVDNADSNYFMTFIKETCMGEMVHLVSFIVAPLLLIVMPSYFTWTIGLPVVIVNMCLQLPSICTLRYTRGKLVVAYKRAKMKEEREAKAKIEAGEEKEKGEILEPEERPPMSKSAS